VVKQALVRAKNHEKYSSIGKNVQGVIFMGTPHRGSDITQWGQLTARALQILGSNPSVFEGLQYDAVSLKNLHTEFIGAYGQNIGIVNVFEERRTQFFRFGFIKWESFVSQSSF
jgi:triacylglycerol esterase/lipase EstA (alpha/beta hydrolase family)